MRVDKFLKVSRIIKRRTVASEACSQQRVTINDKAVKAGHQVNIGDILSIKFGDSIRKYEVIDLSEHVAKKDATSMYKEL